MKAKDDDKTGWISLHRKIQQHWIYPKGREFTRYEAWLDLIMNANHSDQKAFLERKSKTHMVLRGQQIRAMKTLSEKWNWSRSKVRRFLDLLKNDAMIELKSDQITTLITICNYDQYQVNRPTNGHQTDIERTSDGHQTDTNNNGNNDFNNGNNDLKDIFSPSNVILYLNEKTGKHFSPKTENTIKLITARKKEGHGWAEFKKVIDVKTAKWLGDPENDKYLRPETLFTAKHFESYLNERFITTSAKQGLSDMNHELNPNDI